MTIPSIPVLSTEDALGETARNLYENHGILYIPQLLDVETTDRLREVFTEQVERDPSITSETINDGINKDDILSRYPRFVHPHRHVGTEVGDLSRQLFFDHRLHDIAKNLVGPVYGAQSMFHFKPPTARGLAFHQDNYFLQNHPDTCLTAWIAVDHANEESGGLIVVPGTHRSEVICHGDTDSTVSWITKGVTLPPEFQAAPVQTNVRPGDVLFFHGSVVHGSNPNRSKNFRRALIYHYIPQTSQKISGFYFPLLTPEGGDVTIETAVDGGVCGEAWNVGDIAAP